MCARVSRLDDFLSRCKSGTLTTRQTKVCNNAIYAVASVGRGLLEDRKRSEEDLQSSNESIKDKKKHGESNTTKNKQTANTRKDT